MDQNWFQVLSLQWFQGRTWAQYGQWFCSYNTHGTWVNLSQYSRKKSWYIPSYMAVCDRSKCDILNVLHCYVHIKMWVISARNGPTLLTVFFLRDQRKSPRKKKKVIKLRKRSKKKNYYSRTHSSLCVCLHTDIYLKRICCTKILNKHCWQKGKTEQLIAPSIHT